MLTSLLGQVVDSLLLHKHKTPIKDGLRQTPDDSCFFSWGFFWMIWQTVPFLNLIDPWQYETIIILEKSISTRYLSTCQSGSSLIYQGAEVIKKTSKWWWDMIKRWLNSDTNSCLSLTLVIGTAKMSLLHSCFVYKHLPTFLKWLGSLMERWE